LIQFIFSGSSFATGTGAVHCGTQQQEPKTGQATRY
jgi:hypothetical protein